MSAMLFSIWRFRHFILSSISGEFRARFARSRIGAFWMVIHPLAQATIFALVLSEVLGAKLPGTATHAAYPIYLMSGMAAWGLFSEIVNRSTSVFIESASVLKKIAFPRLCLPLVVWGSALVNHLLLLGAIAVVFLFFGHYPGLAWLAIPLGIALISIFAFGLGVMLGIFNVFARDVSQVLGVVMQIWFWLTPVVYTADVIPESLRWMMALNPIVPLVGIYQDALLYNRFPDLGPLAVPAIIGTTLFVSSFILFRRASPELVDAL